MFEKIKWFIAATRAALSCKNNAQTPHANSSDFDSCPKGHDEKPAGKIPLMARLSPVYAAGHLYASRHQQASLDKQRG